MKNKLEGERARRRESGGYFLFSSFLALLLSSFLAFFSLSFAEIARDAGTIGGNFLKVLGSGGSRPIGLGKAYVALAEGIDSIYWNPAGLSQQKDFIRKEFAFSHVQWATDVTVEQASFFLPGVRRGGLGFSFAYLSLGEFDVRDEEGVPQPTTNVLARNMVFTLARGWTTRGGRASLGLGFKMVQEDYAAVATSKLGFDGGIIFSPNDRMKLGAAIQNIGLKASDLVSLYRFGVALLPFEFLTISTELTQASDDKARFALGAEIHPESAFQVGSTRFSLRFGYAPAENYGQSLEGPLAGLRSLGLDRTSGIAVGFGLQSLVSEVYDLGIDYAFLPLGALGDTHHFTLKVKW